MHEALLLGLLEPLLVALNQLSSAKPPSRLYKQRTHFGIAHSS
jgi:hypothetical protein